MESVSEKLAAREKESGCSRLTFFSSFAYAELGFSFTVCSAQEQLLAFSFFKGKLTA